MDRVTRANVSRRSPGQTSSETVGGYAMASAAPTRPWIAEKVTGVVLLAALAFAGSSSAQDIDRRFCIGARTFYDGRTSMCCGGVVRTVGAHLLSAYSCCSGAGQSGLIYKPAEQFCCKGNVYNKTEAAHFGCCNGQEFFDVRNELCCTQGRQGKVHAKARHRACCGAEAYDTVSDLCCRSEDGSDSSVHPANSLNGHHICCGTNIYDTRSGRVCHNGHIMDATVLCRSGATELKYNATHQCCAGTVAPRDSYVCCHGSLHEVDANSICCGRRYIHRDQALCCSGTAHDLDGLSSDTHCCGSSLFQSSSQMCLDGHVIVSNPFGLHGRLCRADDGTPKIVDARREICCQGSVLSHDYLCCGGHVRHKLSNSSRCCGSMAYDSAEDVCNDIGEIEARGRGREAYRGECSRRRINPQTTICCEGRRLSIKKGTKCCGDTNYFEKMKACVDGRLVATGRLLADGSSWRSRK